MIFKKENIIELINGKIPTSIFDDKYLEYINEFNKCNDFGVFFDEHRELLEETEFYEDVLLKIKVAISDIYYNFLYFKEDFDFFIKTVDTNYDSLLMKIKSESLKSTNEYEKQIEDCCTFEMGCGIFSPAEVYSRKLYFQLLNPPQTEECISLKKQLNFCVDSFYSYLYMKTEQILFFFYSLFNLKNDKKLYLMSKYDVFIKENIFDLSKYNFKRYEMDELNAIWKYYKHQEKLDEKTFNKLYTKDFIFEKANSIKRIYDSLSEILKLKKLIVKIHNYACEFEGITNPLGLTGFEND